VSLYTPTPSLVSSSPARAMANSNTATRSVTSPSPTPIPRPSGPTHQCGSHPAPNCSPPSWLCSASSAAFWPSTPTSPRSSPELRDLDILTGLDARGQPTYIKDQNKITLRQLLTHSSGLAYDMFNPTIQQWRASQGQPISPSTTIREPYLGPLLYEPGTGWEYSPVIGFVELMVERVSGARNIQTCMEREIWSSLRIAEMTFFRQGQDDLKARMLAMSLWDEASGKAVLRRRIVQEPPRDAMW